MSKTALKVLMKFGKLLKRMWYNDVPGTQPTSGDFVKNVKLG